MNIVANCPDQKNQAHEQSVKLNKKVDNKCFKSVLPTVSNFHLQPNSNNSPKLKQLPPLSPKIPNKKPHNRCPSFLTQKSKT